MKIRDLLTKIRESIDYQRFIDLSARLNASVETATQEDMQKLVKMSIEVGKEVHKSCKVFAEYTLSHSMPKKRSEEALTGLRKKAEEIDKTIRFTIGDVLPEFKPFLEKLEEGLAHEREKPYA